MSNVKFTYCPACGARNDQAHYKGCTINRKLRAVINFDRMPVANAAAFLLALHKLAPENLISIPVSAIEFIGIEKE